MNTQNLIKTKSSVSLPLKSMKKNGKEMGEAVRLKNLFGVHISRDISLLIQSIFLARQVLKISSLVHTPYTLFYNSSHSAIVIHST